MTLLDIAAPRVEYTGLRPGEKLHEVLFDDADTCGRTKHPRIDVMRPRGSHLGAISSGRWRSSTSS